jgi:predicted peptidase
MRLVTPLLIFLFAFFIFGCNKPEEILPVTPIRDSTARATIAAVPKTDVPKPNTEDAPKTQQLTLTGGMDSYRYGKSQDLPFRILFPKNYDAQKSYPLLVFLHGVSERGTDNEKQLLWGSSLFKADSIRDKYPAFIVFPQCPATNSWVDASSTLALKRLVDELTASFKIDAAKLNIVGLSMGAFGTYSMVAQYPDMFAAAVAISGGGEENKAPIMTKPRWRIFAGKKDTVVPSNKSVNMANALTASGAHVTFTLYPDADHPGSWLKAFAEPDFCSWIFSGSADRH